MATLDVEALLDATASKKAEIDEGRLKEFDDSSKADRSERRDRERDRARDDSRDRKRRDRSGDRSRRDRGEDREATPRSDTGSHKSRRRSRSRDSDRRHSRRDRRGGDGDYYRSGRGGRERSRSRSPYRHYRPRDDRRDHRDDRGDHRGKDDERHRGGRTPKRDATPQLTEDERDRRTVFVQQLAARLRTKELKEFFEKVGPVNEAQIVKDRISGRSKGYVFPRLQPRYGPHANNIPESATLNSRTRTLSLLLFSLLVKNS
jgi:RNA-binding protein 23/39